MQTVLITGISQGIGKALAKTFLEKGFYVVGTSVSGEVDFSHEYLEIIPLDLSSSQSIGAATKHVADSGRKADIVIHNAGVLLDEEETTLIPEKLRQTLEVNLVGTADVMERLVPFLARGAHAIFISSTAGSLERTGHLLSHYPGHYPAYKISKAALNMYMRTLAMRLTDSGYTVSSVHPGWVRTDMGGMDADLSPEEAAADIYDFAITRPETGFFWFKSKKIDW
ncbi:MAG: SDR family NAD(P)-dependent oxidoreductase [Minisyncoccia bacterium]